MRERSETLPTVFLLATTTPNPFLEIEELKSEDILLASPPNIQDDLMSDSVLKYANSVVPSLETSQELSYSCAYLQAIRTTQLEDCPTTGGEYLDFVLTHREILHSCPAVHHDCAQGFSDLACLLEKRPGRSDRDADIEATT
jgi:hypothetical protein